MNKRLITIFFLFGLTSFNTFAGGVSDGGGSSIIFTGSPIDATDVNHLIPTLGKSILAWSYAHQRQFEKLSQEEKQKSPLAKLFNGNKTIIDQIKSVAFEMRMTQPCRDSNNRPVDGSIYGSKPGSLCISPFILAIKLDSNNFVQATAALLIHEISHTLGTSESEAVAIQKIAINDFTNWTSSWGDFRGSVTDRINGNLATLAGTYFPNDNDGSINEVIDQAKLAMDGEPHSSNRERLEVLIEQRLTTLYCALIGYYSDCESPFQGLPINLAKKSSGLVLKSSILTYQMSANVGDNVSRGYVTKIFGTQTQVTMWDALQKPVYLRDGCYGFGVHKNECMDFYKSNIIKNPTSLEVYRMELQSVIDLLTEINQQVVWLDKFKLATYQN